MDASLNAVLDDLEDAGEIDAEGGAFDPAELLDAFSRWAADSGKPLYPHQEEALIELLDGNHEIAQTPTGSCKSMIALAAHFISLARGGRSYYSAPLKALVSEKFFDLVEVFGAHNVGLITGDVALNTGTHHLLHGGDTGEPGTPGGAGTCSFVGVDEAPVRSPVRHSWRHFNNI